MRFDTFLKSSFIVLLFAIALFSATLWPPLETEDSDKPVIDGVIDIGEYYVSHRIGKINLYIYNDEEYATFGLSSPGLGWVAIGFSPVEFHMGANFLFGAVVDGEMKISDQFGLDQFSHQPDVSLGGTSDIVDFAGSEAQGTIVEFQIKMNSSDPYDVLLEAEHTYSIIVAYQDIEDDFQNKHTEKYSHVITLLKKMR